ncbi:tRNA (guanine(10)-N2)-methyltransferase homolog, partial [Varroa destructor]|uniref:tRNA (guanine(10)-N(2))-methyltransferase TRMT11 n=1 Tax=Varroa destructor TaxID=109461 RepID=A0A7M7MIE8_VARDE
NSGRCSSELGVLNRASIAVSILFFSSVRPRCLRFPRLLLSNTILESQSKVAGWIRRSLANFPAAGGVIGSVDNQSSRANAPNVTPTGSSKVRLYLIWFAHEHIEFRHAELQSLIELFGAKLEFVGRRLEGRRLWLVNDACSNEATQNTVERPWMVVKCEDEQHLVNICSKSILIRHVSELMAEGDSLQDVVDQLREKQIEPHNDTFKFEVEAFGKRKIPRCDKIAKMELFDFLPFTGDIDLQQPIWTYHIIEYYGQENNCVPNQPFKVFFGRQVAEGQRELVTRLSLKNREFIANTSMDPTLSVVMSNLAQTRYADFVYDPFVGSASLLVAAAIHDAYVLGMDIDFMLLHGRAKPTRYNEQRRKEGESVRANLRQYGRAGRYVDVIVGDSSRPVLRTLPLLDAILTDPPYGIRESTERIGTKVPGYTVPGHLASQHIPSKISYSLPDVISDLMRFAASSLNLGRRLVFWMPVYRQDFLRVLQEEQQQQLKNESIEPIRNDRGDMVSRELPSAALPFHSCLRFVSASEQRLTSHSSRILLTYEKIKEPKDGELEESSGTAIHNINFRDRYFARRDADQDIEVSIAAPQDLRNRE